MVCITELLAGCQGSFEGGSVSVGCEGARQQGVLGSTCWLRVSGGVGYPDFVGILAFPLVLCICFSVHASCK
jgi:hypothetical protein